MIMQTLRNLLTCLSLVILVSCTSMPTQTELADIEDIKVQLWSEKAVQAFNQGLKAIPKDDSSTDNQYDKAIAAFQLAIKIEPQMEAAYFNLMRLYHVDHHVDNQYSQMRKLLDTANMAGVTSARLYSIYAASLRKQGKFTEAEKTYNLALEQDQNYLTALANMAILQDLYLHDLTKALQYYLKYQNQLEHQNKEDIRLVNWLADIKQRISKLERERTK